MLPWCSYDIIDHGASWLHTSVQSLRFLYHLGPQPQCVTYAYIVYNSSYCGVIVALPAAFTTPPPLPPSTTDGAGRSTTYTTPMHARMLVFSVY